MFRIRSRLTVFFAVLLLTSLTPAVAKTANAGAAPEPTVLAGHRAPIGGWHVQSSAAVTADGDKISKPGFSTAGWYRTGARSTVMAALVRNGKYPDVFHSTNMRDKVNKADFQVPWWFREEFVVRDPARHTFVRMPGAISRADVWVNGTRLGEVIGSHNAREFDVTKYVKAGRNAIALRFHPADPNRDFAISFIDWAQPAPDNNMGHWRDVEVGQSGPVSLRHPYANPKLPRPDRAEVTVSAEVRNNEAKPQSAVVAGSIGSIRFRQTVQLSANETRTVTFPVRIDRPRVWWPAGYGSQPLYELDMTASVAGQISDRGSTRFGIREVTSRLTSGGDRQYLINGKPVQVRAAGWASDLFLRHDQRRLEAQFAYVRNLGLNAIRTEGKLEDQEFYDLADRYGIMIVPSWECCDKWEPWTDWGGADWTPADYETARGSMAAEARKLRNHPSVITYLLATDISPPTDVQEMYLKEMRAAGWATPVVSSGAMRNAPPPLGSSGMKMEGPYDWVPPDYWYVQRLGGAWGFGSELSAGHSIPTLDSLRKMLSAGEQEQLWREPAAEQYHTGRTGSPFNNLKIFSTALEERYGKPSGLADYAEKAQLANYEMTRAQFEAYARNMAAERPATGVAYWMLNNAWPSLNWHLYDNYMNPGGAFFGAKKAGETLHVQYSYDDRSVVVVDQGARPARGLKVRAELYDLAGKRLFEEEKSGVSVSGPGVSKVLTIPERQVSSKAFFVRLKMTDSAGRVLSRNTYWLSSKPDVLDWDKSTWYHTPVSRYADLTDLASLPKAAIEVRAQSRAGATTVTLRNTSKTIAPAVRLTLRRPDGERVLPVTWTDNYVALWPGESVTLRALYRPGDAGGTPKVELGGWNAVPAG